MNIESGYIIFVFWRLHASILKLKKLNYFLKQVQEWIFILLIFSAVHGLGETWQFTLAYLMLLEHHCA
jgi:hypothetical protein